MNKEPTNQVQPEIIPGQLTVEEVLDDTHASEQVQSNISNQQGQTGAPANDPHAADPVRSNITPITHARAKRTKQKSASQVQNGQSVQIDQTGLKSPENALKSGAGKLGAEIVESGAKQVRKQGQRGKDKVPRKKRNDSNQLAFPADDRSRILAHNLNVMKLGRIKNRDDVEEVRSRISFYQYEVLPTVAGLALCLGIDRNTLWDWMDGRRGTIKNPDVVDTLKSVYTQINCQYEDLLTQGKITPVAGFFLMQNNFGYKNTTDHVVSVQQQEEPDTADIAARAGLLEEGDR